MDANDPVFGLFACRRFWLFLGLDDFVEVRVLTQTLGSEYGTSPGGVIEAITKSVATTSMDRFLNCIAMRAGSQELFRPE